MEGKPINKFNKRQIEGILKTENQFITSLFSVLALPNDNKNSEDSDVEISSENLPPAAIKKTSRATSLVELRSRIDKLRNKSNSYKEKLQKKNLKSRLKKKLKAEKRGPLTKKLNSSANTKLPEMENKLDSDIHKTQTVFNKNDKMVFSKIDFSGLGTAKRKKGETNPKKILEQVQEANKKIDDLKKSGETKKAIEIKDKNAWKNALAKTQGIKIKDDPILLKKSILRREQRKRSSKKKWENRIEGVTKSKEEKQKKRSENLDKRKKDKKLGKLKKAAKRGKIIPGL